MHGEGTFIWDTGANYTGTWNHNLMSGEGKMVYKDKSVYEGNWMNDKRNG